MRREHVVKIRVSIAERDSSINLPRPGVATRARMLREPVRAAGVPHPGR